MIKRDDVSTYNWIKTDMELQECGREIEDESNHTITDEEKKKKT